MTRELNLGPISEIEMDSGKVYDVEGRQIAVFRLEDGVYAVENLCPDCIRDLGKAPVVIEESITCPTHGWTLDVVKGECPVSDQQFTTYPVRVEDGRIVVEV